jgi:hypothetical protein
LGKPANDILLYYPIHDTWEQPIPGRVPNAMPHFKHDARQTAPGIAQELLDRGYTFDFVSDRLLEGVQFADGALQIGGARYRAVVVPETRLMPHSTMAKLRRLAEAGATVIFHRAPPTDVPGLGQLAMRRHKFQTEAAALRGRALVGASLDGLLSDAAVQRETLVDRGLHFVRRSYDGAHVYFLVNASATPFAGWLPLATLAAGCLIFDPLSGRRGLGDSRPASQGRIDVYLELAPNETRILRTLKNAPSAPAPLFTHPQVIGRARMLAGPWSIQFIQGGPVLPASGEIPELRSWTDLPGEAVKAFSGTAIYSTTFEHDGASAMLLDLGRVADSARVRVNGREVATLIDAPWRTIVPPESLRQGVNMLEIAVTNLAANRIADLDRRDPGWKRFYNINYAALRAENRGKDGKFNAAHWKPRASGLLGPVTMAPVTWRVSQP